MSDRLKEVFEKHSLKERHGYPHGDSNTLVITEQSIGLMTFDQFEKALSELGVWMSDEDIEKEGEKAFTDPYCRAAMETGMKHYRDNASPVRFVTDDIIKTHIEEKYSEPIKMAFHTDDLRVRLMNMREREIDGGKEIRDLIFKNKEG